MKIYVVLRKMGDGENYDYCGAGRTLNDAEEILTEIFRTWFDAPLEDAVVYYYDRYLVYIIEGDHFEIWEEEI